jgi:hypothetical protein
VTVSMWDAKGVQRLSITDFSPGIYGYGRGQYSAAGNAWVGSAPIPPLGAASFAARCTNEPGVGLVPFYAYSTGITALIPNGNSPAGQPWVNAIPVGLGTVKGGNNAKEASFGGVFLDLGAFSRADYLVYVYLLQDSAGNVYTTGIRWYSSDGVAAFNQGATLWNLIAQPGNMPHTACFTRSTQRTTGAGAPMAQLWLGHTAAINGGGSNPSVMPMAGGQPSEIGSPTPLAAYPVEVFAHSGRVNVILEFAIQAQPAGLLVTQPTNFRFTDPPTSLTTVSAGAGINYFDPEEPSGIGAWGSVSTGELLVVTESRGAFSISGDAAFPSFVNRLPAVHGTGQCKQRATASALGLIYVTDTDGIYAWAGGNTSRKISHQIPDNATIRFDLHPGPYAWGPGGLGAIGVRQFHDRLNQYIFFANNWVLDEESGGWWLAEDPAVTRFGAFQASACGSRFMYCQPLGPYAAGATVPTVQTFDATTAANSWTWISAPIRASAPGSLPNLAAVEVVVSDPGTALSPASPASLTVTPQPINWANPQGNPAFPAATGPALIANSPQKVTFPVPGSAQGYRASQPLGYTDGLFCIRVDAAGQPGRPAPVLHEIHLLLTADRPSGV